MASCALPAAGALALYLLQPSSRCRFKELDPPSRRRVIENLSVLIVHMDILHSPSDGNFKLFSQAKRSLQSVVDMLLQPLNPLGMETSPTQLNAEMPTADWMVPDYCAFDGDFWYVNTSPISDSRAKIATGRISPIASIQRRIAILHLYEKYEKYGKSL